MKTVRLTMAQALVAFLDNQYVDVDGVETKFVAGVFGIFGHGIVVGLGEALAAAAERSLFHVPLREPLRGEGLCFYQAKNEQGAAHAAIGFAKHCDRRRIMAVTSSIGPGALNMVTAAGTATANRIPVLFLPGDAYACRQPDPVLQQIETPSDYNVTANDAFKAVSRYWDRVSRPEQLITAMMNAMRVLTDPADTGAVTIALPQDVQGEAYDYPEEFLAKRVHRIERRAPTAAAVARAVAMIEAARKPLLICGGGARYSGAGRELKAFCEKFHVPFGETQGGKGLLPWDNPYNLSGIGLTGSQAANRLAKEADLVIALGTRLGDFTTCSKWLFQNPDCRILGINVAPFDAYKMNAEPMLADAKLALAALTKALSRKGYRSSWEDEIEEERASWRGEVDRLYAEDDSGGLSQVRALGELNEVLLPKDAVAVSGSGSIPSDMQRVWRTRKAGSYHVEYGFSCMGYEIAGALGVKLAEILSDNPATGEGPTGVGREVVAIVGDGAYTMLHTELLTAVQEGVKIIVVVLDNSGFQCIDNLQSGQGISHFGNEWRHRDKATGLLSGETVEVDFAKNAESWGAKGFRARTVDEFRRAVRKALKEKGPCVIDAKVKPKSMTNGYGAFWRVGTAQVSDNPAVVKAALEVAEGVRRSRQY